MRYIHCICIFALIILSGCNSGNQKDNKVSPIGTWKAVGNPWQITINEDMVVESAIIPLGEVKVYPNKVSEIIMKDDKISTYKAGDFEASYDEKKNELFVSVIIEDIDIQYMSNKIEGNTRDVFVGPISEDGRTWNTTWMSFFDYGPLFPMDEEAVGETLVFEKVEVPAQ